MLKTFSRRGLAALLSQLLPQRYSVSLRSRRRGAAAAKQLAPKDKRDAEIDAARLFPLPREPIMRATALAPFFCLPPFPLRLRRSFGAVIKDINPPTVGVDETDVLKAFASFIIVFTFAFVLGGWFLMPHLPPVPNHRISVFEIEVLDHKLGRSPPRFVPRRAVCPRCSEETKVGGMNIDRRPTGKNQGQIGFVCIL